MDETGFNLRAYFDRMADDKLPVRALMERSAVDGMGRQFQERRRAAAPLLRTRRRRGRIRRVIESVKFKLSRPRTLAFVKTPKRRATWRHRLFHGRRRALPQLSAACPRMRVQARASGKATGGGTVRVSRETQAAREARASRSSPGWDCRRLGWMNFRDGTQKRCGSAEPPRTAASRSGRSPQRHVVRRADSPRLAG